MFTCLIVLILLVQIRAMAGEEMKVHNATLDVAILYDQSVSMKDHQNHTIWAEMQNWIRQYFEGIGANATRFAVIGCGGEKENEDVDPALFFDGSTNGKFATKPDDPVQTIFNAQDYVRSITTNVSDNMDGCARSARQKLFDEKKGDRPGAGNVVLFISDCELPEREERRHRNEMHALLNMTKAVRFICTQSRAEVEKKQCYAYYSDGAMTCWENILDWMKWNQWWVFSFTTRKAFVERLNELLETTTIEVTHCKTGDWQLGCVIHEGKCVKMNYTTIQEHPNPPQLARSCPKNATIGDCDEKECETTTKTTEHKDGSVASKYDVSDSDSPAPNKRNTASDDSSTGTVIGAIVGGVVLLTLIIVIVLVVVLLRKKAKKKSPSKTVGVQGKGSTDKEKCIKVDLDQSWMSKRTGISGKSVVSKQNKSSQTRGKDAKGSRGGKSKR